MTTKVFFPYSWHIDDKEEEIGQREVQLRAPYRAPGNSRGAPRSSGEVPGAPWELPGAPWELRGARGSARVFSVENPPVFPYQIP